MTDFPRPALTVDVIVLSDGPAPDVLLIQRGHEPFAGSWALPGGFVDAGESLEAAAARELCEETGVENLALRQVGTYGDPGRDPRGWTVSVAYVAVVRKDTISPREGDDASAVGWFAASSPPAMAFDHDRILADALRLARERHCAQERPPAHEIPEPPPEAQIATTAEGLGVTSEGWFVLNALRAAWISDPAFGDWCGFEGSQTFAHFGLNVTVLAPGQPGCKYHRENMQEDFLVLSGTCTLLVESESRTLGPLDLVHCPPGTAHVFVGADSEPCVLLMVGARSADSAIHYPVEAIAKEHGASAAEPTNDPMVAYRGAPASIPCAAPEAIHDLARALGALGSSAARGPTGPDRSDRST